MNASCLKKSAGGMMIAGFILYFTGARSGPSCFAAGLLATWLAQQLGPRSIAERAGAVFTAGLIAWLAGPRAATPRESLGWHLFGWALASLAVAVWLHPRRED